MRASALALTLAVVFLAPAARAQEKPELAEIKIDKEAEIKDFLDQVSKSTGKPLLYDPKGQRIAGQKMGAGFSHLVPKDRIFDTFRAILSFFELTLVPIGPQGYEIYLVLDSRSTNNLVKNKAEYVDYRDLDRYRDQDGLYISCTIPIRYIENLVALRTALATTTSPPPIGRVQEVPGSNHVIVMDYAPAVWATYRLITQMDIQPPGKKLVMEFVELQFAYADEVSEIISELVTAQRELDLSQRQQGQPRTGNETPEPRIIAYEPRNALVIAAAEDDLALIKGLIPRFDQAGPYGNTVDVVRLSHVQADDLADTLTQVLEGMGGVLAAPGAAPGVAPRPGGTPTQPGIRRTGGGRQETEPQVVPDVGTNSLILAADHKTIGALKDIIRQLDQPKDQVLIEATLISLTRTDDFQLGVELTGIDEGGLTSDSASGFGVTNFALSTFEDTDGDLIPDINLPTNLATEGGGLVAGIFKSGGIPVLLQAVQRLNNAKLVSMPSVVTYENESAVLSAQNQQPVGSSTELSSGSLQSGFEDFVDAGVLLTVSPHISADNYLRLDIELEVSSFVGDPPSAGLPSPKVVNKLKTTVALPNEHTVVMGGLISEEDSVTEAKVPILGDIPVLGYLFKNKTRRKIKRNLYMFVTPHILRQRGVSFDELHKQSWISKMKADELIEPIDIHNSNFREDPRFPGGAEGADAEIEISSLVDAGRFQEVSAEQALFEVQRLRQQAGK
jgi:general secretion pathway protein D